MASRPTSADMPTEMKKNPSSRPSNGSTSACSSWRYSDSDSSTPAAKAPREAGSPTALDMAAAPATRSRAVAVNTSRALDLATRRNNGRIRSRPPTRITTAPPAALMMDSQGVAAAAWLSARNGTAATSGTEARSWNSSTAKLSRPDAAFRRSRSASIGRTMAVDESASPTPSTAAAGQPAPVQCASTASRAPVTMT